MGTNHFEDLQGQGRGIMTATHLLGSRWSAIVTFSLKRLKAKKRATR